MKIDVMIRRIVFIAIASAAAFAQVSQAQTPVINKGGIVNGASFQGSVLAPGTLVSIFGTELASGLAVADSVPHSTSLANVSVEFNGIAAPLDFVSAFQINAEIPYDVLPAGTNGSVNVTVTRNGTKSAPETIVINQVSPGVFAINGWAVAQNFTDPSDPRYASLAAPVGAIPGFTSFPARVNDVLVIYCTGLGPVNPPVQNGHDSFDQLRIPLAHTTALVAGIPAIDYGAALTPQFPGVYQVNIGVPQVAPGTVPLQLQIGGITSPLTANIAINTL